jgi:GNAT superfamily N-acetyltransferase
MASGLPEAKWNNADIVDVDVDLAALVDWYAQRAVPWGIRVPLDLEFDLGEPLFVKRCAALLPDAFDPIRSTGATNFRRATRDDIDSYAAIEQAQFGGSLELEQRWLSPAIGATGFQHWIAERDGSALGVAMTILTRDRAGPAAYLGGIATVPGEEGRGTQEQLVTVAAEEAFAAGARLIHTNPDEGEPGWLKPLGFVEVPGFLVRLVADAPRRTGPQP